MKGINKTLLITLALSCGFFSSTVLSSEPNSGEVNVYEMTAYWLEESSSTIYRYTFSGTLADSCGVPNKSYALSGDANINEVLKIGYVIGAKVKVGITPEYKGNKCVITFAELVHEN